MTASQARIARQGLDVRATSRRVVMVEDTFVNNLPCYAIMTCAAAGYIIYVLISTL